MSNPCIAQPALTSSVKETTVADVQLNDDGAPSQVNGYRVLKQLGEGTTSKVYHCQDDVGHEYALKILNKSFLKRKREYKKVDGKMVFSNAFQKVQKEVAIMKKLSHSNLVKLHEIIDSPADDKMVLVLELINGGQVMKWEEKGFRYRCPRTTSGVLDEEDARQCMRNIIDALDYLHRNFICHRDIKPENILLLAGEHTYKLADFGVAHMLDKDGDKKALRNTEGTYHFLAPECTTGNLYDPYRVDIWALGVTMFTLLFGTLPFGTKAASLSDVMDSIRLDALELGSDTLGAECEHILRAMMTKDPEERITIEQLKRHPWINCGVNTPNEVSRQEPSCVEVTREEIEAAFTPVNNFILMVRIKMKMAGHLARARNSIDVAKNQSTAVKNKEGRCSQAFPVDSGPRDDLPFLESSTKADGTALDRSGIAVATSTVASPSPMKGMIAMLTRRLSHTGDGVNSSPPKSYDGVALAHGPGSNTNCVGHLKCSTLNDKPRSGEPVQLDVASVLEVQRDGEEANAQQGIGAPCAVRAPPLRSMHHLSAERLPKLDISSMNRSPATSPLSSPTNRRLTPRFSGELVADVDDESGRDLDVVKKSPTEKRNRVGKLHQGTVHPAPSFNTESDGAQNAGEERDEGSEIYLSPIPLPPTKSSTNKKKTQNEAKVAIVGVVHRTTTDPSSPSANLVKEPSVMLHRRKSSNTESAYQTSINNSEGTLLHNQSTAPLPALTDHAGRQFSPVAETPGRKSLAPIAKASDTTSNVSVKQPQQRSRCNDASVHIASERSFCSSGRASTYATEHLVTSGPDGDDHKISDSEGCVHPRNGEFMISKECDMVTMRELELADRTSHSDGSEVIIEGSVAPKESVVAGSRQAGGESPPIFFGILRKNSNSNVVPLTPSLGDAYEGCTEAKTKTSRHKRHNDSAMMPQHNDPATGCDPIDANERSRIVMSSPTAKDLSHSRSPVQRMLSNRRSILDSQDSIRLMIMRRSESVKALLSGKKPDHRLIEGAGVSHALTAADFPPGQSSVPRPGLSRQRRPRSSSVKSASCAIQ